MLKYYDRLLRFKKKKSAGNSALILSKNNGAEMENGAQKSIFYKKKGEPTDELCHQNCSDGLLFILRRYNGHNYLAAKSKVY